MSFDNVSEQLWVCLVIALMSSCISITVTQQEMFRPLREWMVKKCHGRLPVQLFLLF